jgi:uncharacterized protein YkwD
MPRLVPLAGLLLILGLWASARPDPVPEVKLSEEEKVLLDLTNAERAKMKIGELKVNPLLTEAARSHTASMVKTGQLDHTIDGQGPADRLKKVGYTYARYAENIAVGQDAKPEDLFRVWMESATHKANLLNAEYEEIGLGWVRTQKGECYTTQVFGKPLKK